MTEIAAECHAWLTQVVRDTESAPAVCEYDNNMWNLVAKTIVDGGGRDRLTDKLNKPFISTVTSKELITHNKLVNKLLGKSDTMTDEQRVRASKDLAITMAENQRLQFYIPFQFLHNDQSQRDHYAEFDVHERILFNMLHAWDSFDPICRKRFVDAALSRFKEVKNGLDYEGLCMLTKERVLSLVLAARGKFSTLVKQVGDVLEGKKVTVPAVNAILTGHNKHDPDHESSLCEACFSRHYMNVISMGIYAEGASKVAEIGDEARCKRFLDAAHLQSMLVSILYFIWEAVAFYPVESMVGYDTDKYVVEFKLTGKEVPLMFTKDIDVTADGTLLRCNHQGVCDRVTRMFFFTPDYSQVDSILDNGEDGRIHIRPNFDDNKLSILPLDDITICARLEGLYRVTSLVVQQPPLMNKLHRIINKHFPKCPRHPQTASVSPASALWYRLRWVCFEMLYCRFLNVFPEISTVPIPPEEKIRRRLQLTFALHTKPDREWSVHNKRDIDFFFEVHTYHKECQVNLIAKMCREEEERNNRKAKSKPEQQKKTPPPPPTKKIKQSPPQPPPPPPPPPPPKVEESISSHQVEEEEEEDEESEESEEDESEEEEEEEEERQQSQESHCLEEKHVEEEEEEKDEEEEEEEDLDQCDPWWTPWITDKLILPGGEKPWQPWKDSGFKGIVPIMTSKERAF